MNKCWILFYAKYAHVYHTSSSSSSCDSSGHIAIDIAVSLNQLTLGYGISCIQW